MPDEVPKAELEEENGECERTVPKELDERCAAFGGWKKLIGREPYDKKRDAVGFNCILYGS